jgi:aldose 1-epimerase
MSAAGTIALTCGDYALEIMPHIGGAISAFDYQGEPLFRRAENPATALDMACYPLVPFSNRIENGRFSVHGEEIVLVPNFPGRDHPHTLHGHGWLADWEVVSVTQNAVGLAYDHHPDAWPWAYHAEQRLMLSDTALSMELTVTNLGSSAMPAGLGPHPHFPRNAQTRFISKHRGEWICRDDCIPMSLNRRNEAIDWWHGEPVGTRVIDTIYTDREGHLTVEWPDRSLRLIIDADATQSFTVVYVPPDADFFCAEPVTHMINAVNFPAEEPTGLKWLEPGETLSATTRYWAEKIAS